jgi:hypothetical protein
VRAVGGKTKTGGAWHIERRTPGLLENLTDVVLKRTRLRTGSGHRKRGDELPAPYEPDIDKTDRDGRPILTAQGRADMLLMKARNSLSTIIRDLCEHRGLPTPRIPETAQMADWLAVETHAIACDESAGTWFDEIDSLVHNIERAVDRPVGRKWLGGCPTWDDDKRAACGTQLYAAEDALEVYCRVCRATHSCSRLKLLQQNDLERERLTWDRLLTANKMQPDGFRVPLRTLQKWRQDGSLKPRGWLRPDGGHGITKRNADDEPLYLWSDVRKLRERKPQKAATGASAHRKAAIGHE